MARAGADGHFSEVTGGQVSPADKPLKTPAWEPQNKRKGAIGPWSLVSN